MGRLLPLLVAATLLAAAPTPLDPAAAIEVEAVVPIVNGDAEAARSQALDRLFSEAVAVAAEDEAGVGTLTDRPALAQRLRTQARDYVEAYQLLADGYRLSGDEKATGVGAAGTTALPDLPPPGAPGAVAPAPTAIPAPPLTTLPNDHYLLRLRAWVDRPKLRTALSLGPRAAIDLTLDLHGAEAFADPTRLDPLRARLTSAIRAGGWKTGDGEAPHHLQVEATSDLSQASDGRQQIAVLLTGRLQGEGATVKALLQGRGSSIISNLDFAWGEAEEQAVTDLVAHLSPLLRPSHAAPNDRWITVTLAPLPSYGAGIDLAALIRARVAGVTEVQRDAYTDRTLHLRLRTTSDAVTLAAAISALPWRDFTLHAAPRTPTEVAVEVQRF